MGLRRGRRSEERRVAPAALPRVALNAKGQQRTPTYSEGCEVTAPWREGIVRKLPDRDRSLQ